MATVTKIIQLKDLQGNLLIPHGYSAIVDKDGNDITTTYALASTVNTKANDSAVVHKTGNETIAGTKTFSALTYIQTGSTNCRNICKLSNYEKGTAPSSNIFGGFSVYDKNAVEIGTVFTSPQTDGSIRTALYVKSPTSNDTNQIYIAYNSSGSVYTYAPTPGASDSSNKIATTAWANNASNNLVHKSGAETISGAKTFSGGITANVYATTLNALGNQSGTVTLETNKLYSMTGTGAITFSLPTATSGVSNGIRILYYQAAARTITWGTTYFYNGNAPDMTTAGYYDIYFDFNPILNQWVCGALTQEVAS